MASKLNVAYVERGSKKDDLRSIRSNVIIDADMVNINGKVKCMVHQSSSQYKGTRSAIDHVYILGNSANSRKNENRTINIYCGNRENSNCGEKYSWSQYFQSKTHQPRGI